MTDSSTPKAGSPQEETETMSNTSAVPFDFCIVHGRGAKVQRFAGPSHEVFWWECPQCINANSIGGIPDSIYQLAEPVSPLPLAPKETPENEMDRAREASRRYIASLTEAIEKLPIEEHGWYELLGRRDNCAAGITAESLICRKINEIIDRVNYLSERIND